MADITMMDTAINPSNTQPTNPPTTPSLNPPSKPLRPLSQIQQSFTQYSREFDRRNDRRERIYKASRDLTKASKKVIFILQRPFNQAAAQSNTDAQHLNIPATLMKQVNEAQTEVHSALYEILHELTQSDSPNNDTVKQSQNHSVNLFSIHYYRDRYSFGLQEFIESETFLYYLSHHTLMTREQLNHRIREIYQSVSQTRKPNQTLAQTPNQSDEQSTDPPMVDTTQSINFELSANDYLLGIMDLGGELMRFATNQSINQSINQSAFLESLASFLRTIDQTIGQCINQSIHQSKEFSQKLQVWRDCTEKIEKIQYRLGMREEMDPMIVRLIERFDGSEFGQGSIREREEEEMGENKRSRLEE